MIDLQSVSKIYPATQAGLSDLTIQIPDSQWLTLLGPSGSGKTTLLKLLAGLEDKSGGVIQNPYSKEEMSYVFQEPALLPWKNVLDNITLPLQLKGYSSEESKKAALPWLEKLKIDRFIHSFPDELSGGLKMRVSIARALISKPKLLLLDEPFAALDEPIRIELGLELRELWKSLKPTIVMVTHSITEGLWLSDRVVLLQGQPGKIALDQELNLGLERPLEIRGSKVFLENVETCFRLLKGESI